MTDTYRSRARNGMELAGPTDIEADLRICDCGYATDWDAAAAHRTTPLHVERLIEQFRRDGWDDFIAEIENGLGWARNEDMSRGLVAHDDVTAILRVLTSGDHR